MTSERPKIRAGKFGDVPEIFGLLREAHGRSRLAEYPLNEKASKAMIVNAIQRHGQQGAGGQFVAVADNGVRLEGFIIGLLQPLYLVLDALEATDLFWITSPGAQAATAKRLVKAMHKWGRENPDVVKIQQGTTNVISDHRLSGRILKGTGMSVSGAIYEKETRT